MKTPIYLCLAHMGGGEQRYIQEAFDTNWVVPLGPNVNGFEEDLEEFLQQPTGSFSTTSTSSDSCTSKHTPHVCALSSGTSALHLAMVLLDVKAGDEVICQSFTFAASANPITYQGATPVFVDSEPDTWNMSPQLLQEAIEDRMAKTGKKPKAIVVVHLYGMPAKMKEIMEIATHYDIPIIEDAAEALGSTYDGQQCGTFGHFGVLSFNGNKMITTGGGGGAIICPTAEAKQRALFFATQARENYPYYQHEHIGFNYRLSNISAGIGRGQMEVLPQHIAHHQHLADLYTQAFADNPYITLHTNPDAASSSNYWLNTITLSEEAPCSTDELREALAEEKIESRPLWKPMHLQPVFQNAPAYVNGVSEDLFKRGLCLPSGPWVTEEDLQRIVDICRSTLTKEANLKK